MTLAVCEGQMVGSCVDAGQGAVAQKQNSFERYAARSSKALTFLSN
jgi:hypothetical protein